MLPYKNSSLLLPALLLLFIIAATYKLDTLPADWFGDITIVNAYVRSILAGNWPTYFLTSGGPLYMYLVAPVIGLFGISYLTYKLFSVFIAAAGLIAIYFFAKEISSKRIALLTTLVTAFSFWYFVWARLGNYNIIVPGITALMMYCFFRYLKTRSIPWLAFSIFASCLGLFTYAGTLLLPVVLTVLLFWEMKIRRKKIDYKQVFTIAFFFLPGLLLFAIILQQSPDFANGGYMGSKLFNAESLSLNESITRLIRNIIKTVGMLHIEGDIVFRWNITRAPMLDILSGIFFLFGFIYYLRKEKTFLPYILLPLLILPIPSVLPGHPLVEIPSSSRTMAIIPFVFLFVAYGIETTTRHVTKRFNALWGRVVIVISLLLIGYLNLSTYFIRYPQQLPNKNISFGKEIAKYIDTQPPVVPVYLTSLGWGSWAQPSRDSIYYSLKNRNRIVADGIPGCSKDTKQSFIAIFDPEETWKINDLKTCYPAARVQLHKVENQNIFVSVTNY